MAHASFWYVAATFAACCNQLEAANRMPAQSEHKTLAPPDDSKLIQSEVQSDMDWLSSHSHMETQPEKYQRTNAEYARKARDLPFAKDVSEEMFQREVLPYQQLDEPIDEWRPLFYKTFKPLVEHAKTLKEAADIVLSKILLEADKLGLSEKPLQFKGNNTPAIMAPVSETLKHGYASCTGMSILLADCLRSVGIPARVVGTPLWNNKDGGNHNWLEAYFDGDWHFIDSVPGKHEWDKAWFLGAQNTGLAKPGGINGIYTHVWDKKDGDSIYELTWRDPHKKLPAIDRTSFYTKLTKERAAEASAIEQKGNKGGAAAYSTLAVAPLAIITTYMSL
eukprot:gnl/TRDRNA2_/TRDRNA2_190188_c0_seq1.p1 gnl/TRDRNA2_/TRDRNA2_190188_c0~~gnl/TRDRNA2_/TRDRNA2_190188_c0_seq1.p1  ORF type:complete len:335 (-),score=72.81 gnl/TRDRNA2_/TRDRNA2_190188_c0_seq1:46-1050(-)